MTHESSPRHRGAGLGLLLAPALSLSLLGAVPAAQAASTHQHPSATQLPHAKHHARTNIAKPGAIHAAITVNPTGGSAVVTNCSSAGFNAAGGLGTALASGAGSITFACNAAASGAQVGGKWVIVLPQTSSPAIDVASGALSINGSDGGKNDVAIDGGVTMTAGLPTPNTGVQIFRVEDGGASLSLANLTLQNGFANEGHNKNNTLSTDDGYGGAVESIGNFSATNVRFIGNLSYFEGGALELDSSTNAAVTVLDTITKSTFTGNMSGLDLDNDENGGAIDIDDNGNSDPQTVTISQSTFNANSTFNNTASRATSADGGAIYSDNSFPATVNIDHTLFTGNTAVDDGGAVVNFDDNFTVTDSQFGTLAAGSGNTATNGDAGAFYDDSCGTDCTSFLSRDSFVNNSAPLGSGGAIANEDTTEVTVDSTFSGNSANTGGGAIYSDEPTTLVADTIAGNSIIAAGTAGVGAGIEQDGSTLTVQASILSNNVNMGTVTTLKPIVRPALVAGTVVNCSGTITDNGYNLEFSGGAADTCGFTNGTNGDITGADPLLAAPADNGGPDIGALGSVVGPLTMALGAGSPAIAGVTGTAGASPAVTVCTNAPTATPPGAGDVDNRSLPRHAVTRGACDIGAYDTGGTITNPITIAGAFNYLGAGWRLGFAASTSSSYPLGYITFQKGGSTLTARMPITVTCPTQCIGILGDLIPSATVVLKLTGTTSSGRGGYMQGLPVEVDLTLTTTARSATTTPSITASVSAVSVYVGSPLVAQTAVPGATAAFNLQSAVHFLLLSTVIP